MIILGIKTRPHTHTQDTDKDFVYFCLSNIFLKKLVIFLFFSILDYNFLLFSDYFDELMLKIIKILF
jgi:hypothetical protein